MADAPRLGGRRSNGDGNIDFTEFRIVCRRFPLLINPLYTLRQRLRDMVGDRAEWTAGACAAPRPRPRSGGAAATV